MSSPSRLQVALPAVVTFVFGASFGLVAGRILWASKGERAPLAAPMEAGAPMGRATGTPPDDEVHQGLQQPDEAQMRAMLDAHSKLLADQPEDLSLTRTVGNYHAILGENDEALELYEKARALAEAKSDQAQVTDIMIDEGVALVEKGDIVSGLARLEQASARDEKDVRSRLTRVAVYFDRVMMSPNPIMDRKEVVAKSEELLKEVLAIDPENRFAQGFQAQIDSVRGVMGRSAAPAPAAPPAP